MGGKRLKPGMRGPSTYFMSRPAALRKLGISLHIFRTLCILKGIYPKDPSKLKKKTRNRIYFYLKDIYFMLKDPLIDIYRQQTIYRRKIRHAKVKGNSDQMLNLKIQYPKVDIQHIIKERFPTFIDGLHEMNDALTMLYMFSKLPIQFGGARDFTLARREKWQRFCSEWENYIIQTRSLQKMFVSIKGFYFQAKVHSEDITWIVPHSFTLANEKAKRMDVQTMLTFIQLYENLAGFILFRLYNELGQKYPPQLQSSVLDSLLSQVEVASKNPKNKKKKNQKNAKNIDQQVPQPTETKVQQSTAQRIDTLDTQKLLALDAPIPSETKPEEDDDEFQQNLIQNQKNLNNLSKPLFGGLKFFISRECPIPVLEFIIKSFGGEVSCEQQGYPYPETDQTITHQIVDREKQLTTYANRTYVQPQWIFDSVNEKALLPANEYGPTAKLPPHLSPFVDDSQEGYVPERRERLERLKSAIENGQPFVEEEAEADADADTAEPNEEADEEEENAPEQEDDIIEEIASDKEVVDSDEEDDHGMIVDDNNDDDEPVLPPIPKFEEDEELDEELARQRELEAEYATGLSKEQGKGTKKSAIKRKVVDPKQEEVERAKMMLSRKNRNIWFKLKREEKKKQEGVNNLMEKRTKTQQQEKAKKKQKTGNK